MRRNFSLFLAVCAIFLSVSFFSQAEENSLRVDENSTRFFLRSDAAEVLLSIENRRATSAAQIRVEILAPDDSVKADFERETILENGRNEQLLPLKLPTDEENLSFYRLRYRVATANETVSGILAIAAIAPEIFEIEATAGEIVREDFVYFVRVRAVQPIKRSGVAAVNIAGEVRFELENNQTPLVSNAMGVTDAEGFALLRFKMPASIGEIDDAKLKIVAAKNNFSLTAEKDDIRFNNYSYAHLQTDKPLYQPGQKLRVRTLILNQTGRTAPDSDLVFEISDPENQTLQKIAAKTSRFGVASVEWQIPDNAKLGSYSVEVENANGKSLNGGSSDFKVSRYDLPNFVVNAKPDNSFYLPAQKTAAVEVRADYLFGQPVSKAKVRVVREEERDWNYAKQIYETREGEAHEGELDADGKFTAQFDLTAAHADLADDDWKQFEDLRFAAYVTDLTTNRTEQRRFDVRVSREPIHVYLISSSRYSDLEFSRRLNPQFYVSASYADGTPAVCEVKIYRKKDEDENDKPILGKVLARTRTNSHGVGRVSLSLDSIDTNTDDFDVVAIVRDASGRRGTKEENIELADEPAIQITADKTIYRQGESVKIQIVSSEKSKTLFFDVLHGDEILLAERVQLNDGRAEITIPFQPEFKNTLIFAAYFNQENSGGYDEVYIGQKAVVFPVPSGLRIEADTAQNIFRPGAEAKINFSAVHAGTNTTDETALGIVILDKAVDERARTNDDFGSGYRPFYNSFAGLLGLESGFGGISTAEINNLDLSQSVAPDYELAVEIALRQFYRPDFFRSRDFRSEYLRVFESFFQKQLEPVRNALNKNFSVTGETPANAADLNRILAANEIDFAALRDPWNNAYIAQISVSNERKIVTIQSAGADKTPNTDDDLTALSLSFNYFMPTGIIINQAIREYHERTGEFVRDYKTLRDETRSVGLDLDALRDSFGKPYRFSFQIEKSDFVMRVASDGANRKTGEKYKYDDFNLWENRSDYFSVMRSAMNKAFVNRVREKQIFPADEAEFRKILRVVGYDLDALRDVFQRPFYVTREKTSRFDDRIQAKTRADSKTEIKPVSQEVVTYLVKSAGADGVQLNADDFELVRFSGIVAEKSASESKPKTQPIPATGKNRGAIQGTVYDENGAVIPNVKITAQYFLVPYFPRHLARKYETTSNENGFFTFDDLPSGGAFEITFEANGFKRTVMQSVRIQPENSTEIDVTLEVGTINSSVEIIADSGVTVDATDTRVQTSITAREIDSLPISGRNYLSVRDSFKVITKSATSRDITETERRQIETPRLREYFPETLVWQPELVTDANGKAELKFKLADSLTTWKVAVIGSTVDGEIGVAEKEIKTFQPFFAEYEPPKILTEGDKIALPVVVRNYLDTPQAVTATIANADWFKLLSAFEQKITVAPNDSKNTIFNFAAIATIKDGKQRVTAIGTDSSDAIEKTVSVHPNGREISKTQGAVFRDSAAFDVNFPAEVLSKTRNAELKIYPNLMSHVVEAVEGVLQRPYGCGEQTISSSYPALLILKAAKNGGDSALKTKAQRYLQIGYERLLGYKAVGGGFNYWGRGESDLALTVYALRFLSEAKEFIAVDENLLNETRNFLIKQQRPNGSWRDEVRITAYTARILAKIGRDEKSEIALKSALAFLQIENAKIDEPYNLANFALALFDAGREIEALQIAARLETMAKTEADGVFWNLEINTPFNGWGTTGRIETTALVLQVLTKSEAKVQSLKSEVQIQKALQFLFKNKDRYGVWHSTQTTINVLDALILLLQSDSSAANSAAIFVNGQKVREISLKNELNNPMTIDLSEFLTRPNNRIEIRKNGNAAISAQVVQNYYVAWNDEFADNPKSENILRLKVSYDKTAAAIGEEIACRVGVERVGFKGYGMLLAEIGLPPGADVSRESLEKTMRENGNFSSYDVLPDKIIVYLWAQAGGTKFDFKFKLRYGIEAVTAPSTAYDYYNPESNAVLAPVKFVVK